MREAATTWFVTATVTLAKSEEGLIVIVCLVEGVVYLNCSPVAVLVPSAL